MSPNEALDYVLELYDIKTQEVSDKSGVHKSVISKFRNGHNDIGAKNLQKILKILPAHVTHHFNMLYLYGDEEKKSKLKVAEKDNKAKV